MAMRGSRPVSGQLLPKPKMELNTRDHHHHPQSAKTDSVGAPVVKKKGDVRLVIDFCKLSKCIIRPNFETATPFQAGSTIPTGLKFFLIIGALKGYHQVPLDDASIDLTTFSTPFWTVSVFFTLTRRHPCRRRLLPSSIGSL